MKRILRNIFNLGFTSFIGIIILLVYGPIVQIAATQNDRPSGVIETDTVYVAPPTGERETDRSSILAALEEVEPGGIVQFAPGKYVVGKVIQINIPQIKLLGHPDGTVLRGCDPDEFADIEKALATVSNPTEGWAVVSGCGMLELTGGNVTVRNFTFEYTRLGLLLGSSHAEDILYTSEGGYLIEDNTFRNSSNSIRALLASPEPTIIRNNRFINVFHVFSGAVSNFHILDNHISAPEPNKILPAGHPGFAIGLSALVSHDTVTSSCKQNLIAGNQIKGHPDGIILLARQSGVGCQDNVIRANTFEDIASYAVVLEGDSNRVEMRDLEDKVRDLGSGNLVTISNENKQLENIGSWATLKDTIVTVTRNLANAWIRLDPEGYLSYFSDDLIFYFQGARFSRVNFEAIVRESLNALRESTFEIHDPEVKVLGPDAAVITFRLHETMIDKNGNRTIINGMLSLVYEHRNGQWQIVRAHESLSGNEEPQE